MLLWACAGVPLGAYNIASNFNIALQIQPQILTVLSLITWIQCYHYDDKWGVLRCCAFVGCIGAIFGGVEVGLVFALKAAQREDRHWPVTLMGVVSTVLLSAGVLRHYWDIYVHRTVRGISFIFVGIDAAGDVFSLVSVFFQPTLDVLGMVIYATEFVLWCGVFACGGYFNLAPWIRQKVRSRRQRREETSIDLAPGQGEGDDGVDIANDVNLRQVPSSTSVFRTPSSVLSERMLHQSSRQDD
ncbi:related to Integral membrane protein [Phialocephala subalpina]|uniref:Related to Integral membrane protein n=1 Tax=Phialocephala subalpina TaxID=576137 RepID=A0A1L7XNB2_9HELO|nr:related to Integral membrane protein [Phialocephala subalpina]